MARYSKLGQRVSSRVRTKRRIRKRVVGTEQRPRLSVFRSGQHTYAQVICDVTGRTMAAASTKDKDVLAALKGMPVEETGPKVKSSKGVLAAKAVGKVAAERALSKNIAQVVFDRNGYLYHGRVQAVADGAREGGLKF